MWTSLLLSLAAALPPTAHRDDHWIADWDAAAKLARESGKDLLVDFTGSDWCGWCIKLHEEVFQHDAFLTGVADRYVLCALDYPNGDAAKAKVPNPARNDELQKKYAIRGFPTILLMTPAGDVFGKTGYQPGGPEAYVTHLGELATPGKAKLAELTELEQKIGTASGKERDALLDGAIAQLEGLEEDSPFGAKLAAIVRRVLDDGDKAAPERRLRVVKALLQSGQGDEALLVTARTLDPKNEKGLLEHVVSAEMAQIDGPDKIAPFVKKVDELISFGPLKDKKLAFELCMNCAYFNHQFVKDAAAAKKYATMVKETGEEIPDRAMALLDQILGS